MSKVIGVRFKEGGKIEDKDHQNVRVDIARVKEFMEVVFEYRKTL